jgi:hypothetical protein
VFVRHSLESFFAEALGRLPVELPEKVSLEYTGPESDNLNVSGSALHKGLRLIGTEPSADPHLSPDIGLRFSLSEIEFSYENRGGSIFSRGDLYRVLEVAGSLSLSKHRLPIWEDYLIREYTERIELSERNRLESNSSPLFKAELPPGPVQKLWEPVIVTSVVGGLVYLFFASR